MPFQLIVGEKEAALGSVSVRKQGGEDLGVMTIEEFSAFIKNEIKAQLEFNK